MDNTSPDCDQTRCRHQSGMCPDLCQAKSGSLSGINLHSCPDLVRAPNWNSALTRFRLLSRHTDSPGHVVRTPIWTMVQTQPAHQSGHRQNPPSKHYSEACKLFVWTPVWTVLILQSQFSLDTSLDPMYSDSSLDFSPNTVQTPVLRLIGSIPIL